MSDVRTSASLYLNRELSWLAFNARVLHEALDPRVPLLERVKFLGDLQRESRRVLHGPRRRTAAAGRGRRRRRRRPTVSRPQEQLDAIDAEVARLSRAAAQLSRAACSPSSRAHGVRLLARARPDAAASGATIDEYFESQIFPVLTPLAVDPGHPFPYISNLSLSLAVEIRDPDARRDALRAREGAEEPAALGSGAGPAEPLRAARAGDRREPRARSSRGWRSSAWYAFRITRYSDLDIPVEEPEDLLATIEEQVFQRRFGEVVRVEVQDDMPAHLRALLLDELREDDVAGERRVSASATSTTPGTCST